MLKRGISKFHPPAARGARRAIAAAQRAHWDPPDLSHGHDGGKYR
jgi:hypothetical protein